MHTRKPLSRALAVALCVIMAIGVIPFTAFAYDASYQSETHTVFKHTEDSLKLAFAGALFAFLYCWIMIVPTMWVLKTPFIAYLISDIGFELLLAASSFLGILLLYEPLSKLLRKLLKTEMQ